jgi:hypothetical protein
MNLYNQLSLITGGDRSYLAASGIGDLYRYFLAARRSLRLRDGVFALFNLLQEVGGFGRPSGSFSGWALFMCSSARLPKSALNSASHQQFNQLESKVRSRSDSRESAAHCFDLISS